MNAAHNPTARALSRWEGEGGAPLPAALREQFPGLAGGWHYLDSAATAQKPQAVIDAVTAALGRDYPTLLGVLTFSSLLVIVANLLTDMSYRWIDPRLRGK